MIVIHILITLKKTKKNNRLFSILFIEFCNEDIKKIILLLRKGVYPDEYMDS